MTETTIPRPDGARIRMRDHGASIRRSAAPALVLSNSLATDSALWDEVVGRLSADYRVLTYDTRGHGGPHGSGDRDVLLVHADRQEDASLGEPVDRGGVCLAEGVVADSVNADDQNVGSAIAR